MKKTTMLLILAAALFQGVTLQAQERPWLKYITPSGYFQTGFQMNNSFDNSFYIKRARISLAGTVYQGERFGKLEYKVQAELANSPKLVDYFLKYTVCDEFGIQLGQFKSPLSIENSEYAPLKLEFIDYSLMVQRFCRMSTADLSGISSTGREMGLQFFGNVFKVADGHALVRYNVAVFNGTGINKMDDDQRKDFVARLMIFPIKDLNFSGYYQRSLGPHSEIAPEYNDYDWYIFDRYGGGIAYDSKYGWLRAEYMAGHTFGYRAEGAYGSIGAKIGPKWAVGARYDYFNENSRETGHIQHYFSGAVNWQPVKHLRVQLNYMYKIDPGKSPVHLVNLMTSISL